MITTAIRHKVDIIDREAVSRMLLQYREDMKIFISNSFSKKDALRKYSVIFMFGIATDRKTGEERLVLDGEVIHESGFRDTFSKYFNDTEAIQFLIESNIVKEVPVESRPCFNWAIEDLRKIGLRNKNIRVYEGTFSLTDMITISKF